MALEIVAGRAASLRGASSSSSGSSSSSSSPAPQGVRQLGKGAGFVTSALARPPQLLPRPRSELDARETSSAPLATARLARAVDLSCAAVNGPRPMPAPGLGGVASADVANWGAWGFERGVLGTNVCRGGADDGAAAAPPPESRD